MTHVVIIGNGISGITAARHIRKLSDMKITVISAESEYFFSRTALMYVYMGHMKFEHTYPYEPHFWSKNNINLVFDYVSEIDFKNKLLHLKNTDNLHYDKLIIAVGSKPNKFGWKGQNLKGVQGLYSKQDLEMMQQNTKNISEAVVVGGGLIGVEMAEMLHSQNIKVTFLVRENHFWGSVLPPQDALLIENHIKKHGVNLLLNEELDEINGNDKQQVAGIKTKSGKNIPCRFVGLAVGVSPNIDFLKNQNDLAINRGILVNEFLETNLPNVYAIGDCAEFNPHPTGRRNIEQVWYTGKMMGETVAQTICGNKMAYRPGIWFNSAKFFDIEYQTYGSVPNNLSENEIDFYWQHPQKEIAIHLVFDKITHHILGINTFGIRLRHEICTQMIAQKNTVSQFLEHFNDALFDPELYKNYANEIITTFNKQFNTTVSVKKKNWQRILNVLKH